jgi:hypothetical protein
MPLAPRNIKALIPNIVKIPFNHVGLTPPVCTASTLIQSSIPV